MVYDGARIEAAFKAGLGIPVPDAAPGPIHSAMESLLVRYLSCSAGGGFRK